MIKHNLQTKIIFIFFILVAIILISTTFFSYYKIKQMYINSLEREYNTAYNGFSTSITQEDNTNILNFIKYFGINNKDRIGYIFDSNYNMLNDLDNELILKDEEIKDIKAKSFILLDTNDEYQYKKEVKDVNGSVRYIIFVIQSKEFINLQLNEYKFIVTMLIIILLGITLIISAAISRDIIGPINKLTKNLDEIITGNIENIENIKISNKKNEIYELVERFKKLTNTLNDNLKEISSQKAQIEAILLHMSDGVMAFDVYGNLIYKNPSAIKLLNIDNELIEFDKIFKKLNVDVNFEKIIYLQDWTSCEKMLSINEKYVNMYFEPFKNEEDDIEGVIVLIQNITEQVKLDNMRKEFVANVSHELKTPITSIKSYSEALLEDNVDKETSSRFLSVISNEAQRMARLVSDLLQLSKFDINKTDNKKVEFDLGELVKRTYDKISIEADKRGHEVECYVTADVPKIYADKDGIEQVLLNVMSNAIKYTPDYGKIKIYVGFVYNHAYVKVIDNGIGIPKKDLKRVFERFYRVDKARSREQGGTGLGLAIAKEIVERNQGSIDINSTEGKGTELIIRLPVKQQKQDKSTGKT